MAGFSDGSLRIWDMKTTEQAHHLTGVHREAVVSLSLTPTNLLLSGSSDGTVGLWNCSNGEEYQIIVDIRIKFKASKWVFWVNWW